MTDEMPHSHKLAEQADPASISDAILVLAMTAATVGMALYLLFKIAQVLL